MDNGELLKNARNILLRLHKSMVDLEREMYEGIHGKQTPGQFLNLLLEDEDMAWLRKFSMLIVEIDEMFDLKEGIEPEMIDAKLGKIRELVAMAETDDYFKAKYQFSLTRSPNAAMLHSELKGLLKSSV
jgi:hypothetical protein